MKPVARDAERGTRTSLPLYGAYYIGFIEQLLIASECCQVKGFSRLSRPASRVPRPKVYL